MSNLANKSFRNNKTGEVIKVIDNFENIAILENREKVDVRQLLDTSMYTEQIDVNNFFNNQGAYNSLAEKIKNIPMDNIRDDEGGDVVKVNVDGRNIDIPSVNDSAVIMSDPEQEKLELAKKYGATLDTKSVQSQNDAFAKILGDDNDLPKVVVNNNEYIETSREYIQPNQKINMNDPITQMFSNVKRNVSFKMNIEISNKIPRLDFIEMMEDSYEVSIIDYLADEFTKNLLKDPSQIKEMIKDRIKKVVYGADIKQDDKQDTPAAIEKSPVKKKGAKKIAKKESVKND